MLASKAQTSNLLSALVAATVAFIMAGCDLPSPQRLDDLTQQNNIAPFSVKSYKATLIAETEMKTFSINDSRSVSFEVCLETTSNGKAIKNIEFNVRELDKNLTSSLTGCLSWQETFEFDPAAEEKVLLLKRTIQGSDLFRGSRQVTFAFNPWSIDDKAVIIDGKDAPKNTITDQAEVTTQLKAPETVTNVMTTSTQVDRKETAPAPIANRFKLWVDSGRLFGSEKSLTKDGLIMNYEVHLNPSLQTKTSGKIIQNSIENGQFVAEISFFHRKENTWFLLAKNSTQTLSIKDKALSLNSDLLLPLIPTRGQIFLGLKLTPLNSPVAMESFEGVFFVGDFDAIKAGGFLKISALVTSQENFKLASLNATLPSLNDDSFMKPQVEIAPIEFRFLRVDNETATSRDVHFQVRACLRNGIDQKLIRAETFDIEKLAFANQTTRSSAKIRVDNASCLHWEETIPTLVYQCQHYKRGTIRIKNTKLGLDKELSLAVNPWEQSDAAGRDLRYVELDKKAFDTCEQQKNSSAHIHLDSYSYSTLSYAYSINENMSLQFKKKVLLKLDPKVLAYSNQSLGRENISRLRDGNYLLRMAILRNPDYDNQRTYIFGHQSIVTAISGQIVKEIELSTTDLRALGNRNQVVIEIFPVKEANISAESTKDIASMNALIDQSSGLISGSFTGGIIMNLDETTRTLSRTDINQMAAYFSSKNPMPTSPSLVGTLIEQGEDSLKQQQTNLQKIAQKETFAAKQNLSLINLNDSKWREYMAQIAGMNMMVFGEEFIIALENQNLEKAKAAGQKDDQAFTKLLQTGVLTPALAEKLCAYWAFEFTPKLYKQKGGGFLQSPRADLFRACGAAVLENPASFFATEKFLTNVQINKQNYLGGTNHGVSIGTGFSLANSRSHSLTRTTSVSVKAGLSVKMGNFASVGADTGYSISDAISDSESSSNSITVSATTSMTVQRNRFELTLNAAEACVSVKLNPMLFMKDTTSPWYKFANKKKLLHLLNPELNSSEQADVITRGILICSGSADQKNQKVTEDYFTVVQETSSTQTQDPGDERNRQFFIALRGQTDYSRFMTTVRALHSIPETAQNHTELHGKQVSDTIEAITKGSATHPGFIKVKTSIAR